MRSELNDGLPETNTRMMLRNQEMRTDEDSEETRDAMPWHDRPGNDDDLRRDHDTMRAAVEARNQTQHLLWA